jgi:hypothetical protein
MARRARWDGDLDVMGTERHVSPPDRPSREKTMSTINAITTDT